MIRSRIQPLESTDDRSNKTIRAFKAFCNEIWIVPAIALVITILILVIEHTHLSHIGTQFVGSFIYAMLIGLSYRAGSQLDWVSIHASAFPGSSL